MKLPFSGCTLTYYPNGSITQYFGENPSLYSSMGMVGHNGIDLVAKHGTPLLAVEDGTVCDVRLDETGYGRHVRFITSPKNGTCRVWTYGHCDTISVKVGDEIHAGDQIATMGNTGFCVTSSDGNGYWKFNPYAGTHLHLGVREVKRSKTGWAYEGSTIKMRVLNEANGYKGSIDPLPFFSIETTPNIENLKTQVSLLTKVLELLKLKKQQNG